MIPEAGERCEVILPGAVTPGETVRGEPWAKLGFKARKEAPSHPIPNVQGRKQ